MSYKTFIARKRSDGKEQSVSAHLEGVAKLAEGFFKFDARLVRLARAAARLHDVGKFSEEFQEYIRIEDEALKKRKHGKIDHATAADNTFFCAKLIEDYI